jgi:hypothetical protein
MARISTLAVVAGALAALALAADSASAGSNTAHITVPTVPTAVDTLSGQSNRALVMVFPTPVSRVVERRRTQCQRFLTGDN